MLRSSQYATQNMKYACPFLHVYCVHNLEEYNLLDSLTKSFPGRAERDNWAAQATELMTK